MATIANFHIPVEAAGGSAAGGGREEGRDEGKDEDKTKAGRVADGAAATITTTTISTTTITITTLILIKSAATPIIIPQPKRITTRPASIQTSLAGHSSRPGEDKMHSTASRRVKRVFSKISSPRCGSGPPPATQSRAPASPKVILPFVASGQNSTACVRAYLIPIREL